MQLPVQEGKFDQKKIEQLLVKENRFVLNLLSIAGVPERRNYDEDDIEDEQNKFKPHPINVEENKKSRAKSLHELEERLKTITSKKKLSYKDKLMKKGLKNRMKKKNKQDSRNAKLKLERAVKSQTKSEHSQGECKTEEKKPIFNSENKMVFSKIDFDEVGKKTGKKQEKDPEKILKKLTEEKSKLQELEMSGETKKVVEMKEKVAWKNALAKAQGQKVKDDPELLKKSLTRKEQKVRSSKKKWEARITGVKKAKEEKQKKRSENIAKRKKDKKVKKLKNAAKRGKIIPGF
ncbi:hypothetical protein ABEB36_012692 [Hypothenemus hampei]|uniref:Ribosomal RNA-processing protein 14/surfeit locus protein 6 C-terminal domain-containing protein n=1 Tax=Hypothenemus hampei TaxID=57062 RepID=A0ABD1EC65_HYPHA